MIHNPIVVQSGGGSEPSMKKVTAEEFAAAVGDENSGYYGLIDLYSPDGTEAYGTFILGSGLSRDMDGEFYSYVTDQSWHINYSGWIIQLAIGSEVFHYETGGQVAIDDTMVQADYYLMPSAIIAGEFLPIYN